MATTNSALLIILSVISERRNNKIRRRIVKLIFFFVKAYLYFWYVYILYVLNLPLKFYWNQFIHKSKFVDFPRFIIGPVFEKIWQIVQEPPSFSHELISTERRMTINFNFLSLRLVQVDILENYRTRVNTSAKFFRIDEQIRMFISKWEHLWK